jgi:hypothetical protein
MRNWHGNLSPFGSWHTGKRAARVITAIIRPSLAPLFEGDTIEDALSADIDQTANYVSKAGNIASVVVDVLVNGSPPAGLDIPLDAGDVVAVTVTVTDDASPANVRIFSLGRTVQAAIISAALWAGTQATWGSIPATWGTAA